MRVARRRVEDLHGAVRATLLADLDAARAGASCRTGFPVFPQGLDLAKPVMYLSWTGDVLVVYPPYTCAGNARDREAARSACGCERDARTAEVNRAKESGASQSAPSALPARLWTEAQLVVI